MAILDTFTALDFETANSDRTSVCSIGLARVENGRLVERIHRLINPLQPFLYWNTQIHGISAFDVRDAPAFPEVWEEVSRLFGDVVVAHNAAFDISCLKATIERFGIEYPKFKYFCTLNISRRFLKTPSHKLDALARYYNLPSFHHHNALADAIACAEIFLRLERCGDVCDFERDFLDRAGKSARDRAKSGKNAGVQIAPERRAASSFRLFQNYGGARESQACKSAMPTEISEDISTADTPLNNALRAARKISPVGRISYSAKAACKKDDSFFYAGPVDFTKTFFVAGRFAGMDCAYVRSLITRCGGKVADDMAEYPDYVIAGSRQDFGAPCGEFPEAVYIAKKLNIPVVGEASFLRQLPE